jgi:hypothetical protein
MPVIFLLSSPEAEKRQRVNQRIQRRVEGVRKISAGNLARTPLQLLESQRPDVFGTESIAARYLTCDLGLDRFLSGTKAP